MFSNVKKYNINHIHNRTKCGIHSSTTFNWKGGMNEENQWKIGKKCISMIFLKINVFLILEYKCK